MSKRKPPDLTPTSSIRGTESNDQQAYLLLMELIQMGKSHPDDPTRWRPLLPAFAQAYFQASNRFQSTVSRALSDSFKNS